MIAMVITARGFELLQLTGCGGKSSPGMSLGIGDINGTAQEASDQVNIVAILGEHGTESLVPRLS